MAITGAHAPPAVLLLVEMWISPIAADLVTQAKSVEQELQMGTHDLGHFDLKCLSFGLFVKRDQQNERIFTDGWTSSQVLTGGLDLGGGSGGGRPQKTSP